MGDRDDPSLVLAGIGSGGSEDRLTTSNPFTEMMLPAFSGLEVVLPQR